MPATGEPSKVPTLNPALRVPLFGFFLSAVGCHATAQMAPTAPSPRPTASSGEPAVEMRIRETPAQHDARMAWWREAKFGMFIHWGLYALPADGEWHLRAHQMPIADYSKYAAEFNPTKFNADEWAALAHDAGMKYLVMTTKHHDGFAMFHSQASDITSMTQRRFSATRSRSFPWPARGTT